MADASPPATPILLVCNPGEAAALRRYFAEPLPCGPVVLEQGDGGDDTLARFERLRPAVVIVCATLDAGDTRALLAAMRAASPGTFRAILIGDERGPVRNALDAADFGVDRFVARPIAAKALRFAVSSSIDTLRAAPVPRATPSAVTVVSSTRPPTAAASAPTTTTTAPDNPTMLVPPVPTIPGMGGAPPRRPAHTPPEVVPAPPEAVRTELRARWSKLADAISDRDVDLGADEDDDDRPRIQPPRDVPTPAPVVIRPRRMTEPPVARRTPPGMPAVAAPESTPAAPAEPKSGPNDARRPAPSGEYLIVNTAERRTAPTGEEQRRFPRAGTPPPVPPQARRTPPPFRAVTPPPEPEDVREEFIEPDDLEEIVEDPPDFLPREPTLILPGDAAASGPIPIAGSDSLVVTERHVGERWTEHPVQSVDDDARADAPEAPDSAVTGSGFSARPSTARTGRELDELGGPRDRNDPAQSARDDAHEDLVDPAAPADEPPLRPSDPNMPSGGDFARELRRKMSQMAQRLFKSPEEPDAPAVDVGVRHDHKTEIDLVALVDGPAGGMTEIEAREEPKPSRDDVPGTSETQVRPGAESGDVIRGVSDAAAILARAFAHAFTGRAVLRQPDAERPGQFIEKQIFFDRGRPVFAASNHVHDRMGQLLVREGKITQQQFERCQTIVAASGRRMGEILVDLGFLKRRELLPAVRRHVEDIIYSAFAWSTGQFQMIAGDGAANERIRLSRHPAGMVLEGVRRKLGFEELERLVGPPTTVVEIGDKDKLNTLIGTADLSPEERAAVAALDGVNDLAAVARASGADLANVLPLAWGLMVLGVAFARRRTEDVDGEDAVLVGETDLAIDRERVHARWQLVTEADYFALLGVRRDATGFEIKRAYEAARRDFAPDGFPPELRRELARELDEIAQVLDEAFHVLRDDTLRGDYLRHLRD